VRSLWRPLLTGERRYPAPCSYNASPTSGRFRFVFGRGCDRILVRTSAVLTEVFLSFHYSIQAIVVIPGLVHDHFLPNHLQLNIIVWRFVVSVLKGSIDHLRYAVTPKQDSGGFRSSCNTADFHSGRAWFASWPWHRLSSYVFHGVSQPLQVIVLIIS
jgi:hypothetical protein